MFQDPKRLVDSLRPHWQRLENCSIASLFEKDEKRFEDFSLSLNDIVFDFSKTRLDGPAYNALIEAAESRDIEAKRAAMFSGEKINITEDRAVLHTALRNQSDDPVLVDGEDVMPQIREVLGRMETFADSVRSGEYRLRGGKITDVVNIGIGGSDLGPKLVARALSPYADGPDCHFVSNVDGADIADTLRNLDPKTTLFIVASKTFTTQETMANAQRALVWVRDAVGMEYGNHFVGLTTNLTASRKFGIDDERTFGFWDWVGGRYSVWSAIGLSVMISIGPENFSKFLQGAFAADKHFESAPLAQNIPVVMAMLGIWHRNVCGYPAQAMLPYDNRLVDLPRWLQQLDMESNGKGVTIDGAAVETATGPIVFGEPGTNGQHAFYQLLHQGTAVTPCDFLVAVNGHEPELQDQHALLVANCLAQSEALMMGRTLEEADGNPHRLFDGNRPSCTFIYKQLDPQTLGSLLALYEHKIFVQGVFWGINSFDQWGVELGKELANRFAGAVESEATTVKASASTTGLLSVYHNLRN